MASTTSNLGLTKPANGENYSLDVWNQNMQKIDDELPHSYGTLTTVNDKVTNTERARYNRFGRVVVVGLTFTVTGTISGATDILFSGLPPAATPVRAVLAQSNGTKIIRVEANQLGNITNAYSQGGITDGVFEGELVYVCST